MDLARKKLGLLLSTGPEHRNVDTAIELATAAIDRGASVYLYLIDDGVRMLAEPRLRGLPGRGVKLFVCAYGCQKRRIPLEDSADITYCGLVVLTDLINGTDRFVALKLIRPPAMTDQAPVLVLIGADPRQSHRANEALRIALGIVSGENEVIVVLSGPAVHLLDEDTDELIDGDDIAKFRANFRTLDVPFHIAEGSSPADRDWNVAGHSLIALTPDGMADLMRRSRRTLIF